MFKNRNILIVFLILTVIVISGCGSTNKYMKKNTKEFGKVTNHFVGKWAVEDYQVGGNEYLKGTFEKITADIDFDGKTAKYTYVVSESKIAEKLIEWREKYPDLNVEEYKVTVTSMWSISKKGDILYYDEQNPELVIKGTGENFRGFYDWERTKFEAAKSAGKAGEGQGLKAFALGKLAGAAVKKATGTSDFFPKLDSQFNFKFSSDKRTLTLNSIMKTKIKLSKTN